VPTTLPIPNLVAPVATPTTAPRFRSALLAATPKPGLVQEVRDLSRIYADIAMEWRETTDDESRYQSAEERIRELLLGAKGIADQLSRRDLQREVEFAFHDFDTAVLYSGSDLAMTNMYISYALLKIHGIIESASQEVGRKSKLGYGYDISGEVQRGGGTSGEGRHLWDTGNSPKHDHTQNNPANMLIDAEAESDYPELAKFKHKRVHWPPRIR